MLNPLRILTSGSLKNLCYNKLYNICVPILGMRSRKHAFTKHVSFALYNSHTTNISNVYGLNPLAHCRFYIETSNRSCFSGALSVMNMNVWKRIDPEHCWFFLATRNSDWLLKILAALLRSANYETPIAQAYSLQKWIVDFIFVESHNQYQWHCCEFILFEFRRFI